jgi:hypothetical protein
MDKFKTVLNFMLAGALLGNWVASLVAPRYQVWNNSAPLASVTQCNLPEVIQSTASDLVHAQLIGSGIGAVAFLVLGILFLRFRSKKQQATPPPPAAPTIAAS